MSLKNSEKSLPSSLSNNNNQKSPLPLRSLDLEKWRVKNGLTITAACELLGLQRSKWAAMQENPTAPIDDMAVCILLELYEAYPKTMPITRVPSIKEFMIHLGFNPNHPTHKKEFALLMGREPAAAYRWTDHQGNISKPLERIVEAMNRMPTTSGAKKRISLRKIAEHVAKVNGCEPFKRNTWRHQHKSGR